MPTINADIEFEVFCASCGAGLCGNTDVYEYRGNHQLKITPCSKCLDNSEESGYEKGKKDGYDERIQEENDL